MLTNDPDPEDERLFEALILATDAHRAASPAGRAVGGAEWTALDQAQRAYGAYLDAQGAAYRAAQEAAKG